MFIFVVNIPLAVNLTHDHVQDAFHNHRIPIPSVQCLHLPYTSSYPSPSSEAIHPYKDGYRLEPFGTGAYMTTDSANQSLFFVACESVIVVDAPPTTGHNILKAVRSVTELPISHLIYSHSHADHVGAAYLLGSPSNITIIAHQETADKLALTPDYAHRPYPTTTFTNSYKLDVCNQTLHLDYNGPNHEPGNIFIYAPLQKLLMLVDIVYPGWAPYENLGEAENLPGFFRAHEQILTYDFEHYIGGHHDRTGTRSDVLLQRAYVRDLFDTCISAIQLSGEAYNGTNDLSVRKTLPEVEKANPWNAWAEFKAYNDGLVEWIANETIAKWRDRLAGMDVHGLSNARTMLEPVRIDWGVLGPF